MSNSSFNTFGLAINQDCETLGPVDIAMYAAEAGFSTDSIPIIGAIALAESGGRTCAHNAVPPDDSYGLTQVNMLGPLGPQRRASFGLRTNDELFDPQTNLDAAFEISGGGRSFTPWTTFTSGRYRQYLSLFQNNLAPQPVSTPQAPSEQPIPTAGSGIPSSPVSFGGGDIGSGSSISLPIMIALAIVAGIVLLS